MRLRNSHRKSKTTLQRACSALKKAPWQASIE